MEESSTETAAAPESSTSATDAAAFPDIDAVRNALKALAGKFGDDRPFELLLAFKVKRASDAKEAIWVPLAEVRPENMFEDHYHIIQTLKAQMKTPA